ncbi:hypothetical protein GS3922_11530 [Geobacillus subterraneus]|uniref:Secreted protein n=1 Tax=Geobacillus subterraneus TaxID=129338 RepID=A0ABM6AD74_9BACL|nr:hypothetical protein [Geobacillus subterraneus]AMX84243.1 hypothetical protein GS3922_11530 [Geobacillus subterraneus]QIZ67121.1 hypothetical protein HF500_07635 [Geobacillus subterraneus]
MSGLALTLLFGLLFSVCRFCSPARNKRCIARLCRLFLPSVSFMAFIISMKSAGKADCFNQKRLRNIGAQPFFDSKNRPTPNTG